MANCCDSAANFEGVKFLAGGRVRIACVTQWSPVDVGNSAEAVTLGKQLSEKKVRPKKEFGQVALSLQNKFKKQIYM